MAAESVDNQAFSAYEGDFHQEPAIWLKAGRYEAALLPAVGGNMVAFRDTVNDYRFLHEPAAEEMASFKARPMIHGIPVLFPPNRYDHGKFPWRGQVHQLPVNETNLDNHLHGFVYNIPWQLDNYGSTSTESYVVVSITVDEQHPVYQLFPFLFTIRLEYRLSGDGLSQLVRIRNNGQQELPSLLAFHTAVNAPFAPGSQAADYRVKLTIGERWQMSERMLPTGEYQQLSADEQLLKGAGVYPFFTALDNHYTAVPQQGRNRMELTDHSNGVTLVYDVGTSYKQWMIWNNFANGGFFCPEPQVNLVNAPSVDLPAEQIGLFGLLPGEIWEERARFYIK